MIEPIKLRRYEGIWEQIKLTADDPDKWVPVRMNDIGMMQTIINMVMIEKSAANKHRKQLDLPLFGKLVIDRQPDNKCVRFKLKNSGANL